MRCNWAASALIDWSYDLLSEPEQVLLLLLLMTRRADDPFPWTWVIAWYALAKAAEEADRAIWSVTGGVIAGHTLKHLLAAAAVAAALWPLRTTR